MVGTVIGLILGNAGLLLILVALVVAFVKHRRLDNHTPLAQVLWNEMVFYAVGIGFLYVGVFHAFFQEMTSAAIGWAPSPFEWELACAEFGVGAMGVWSLWRSNEFRLPVTLIFAIFSLGAAVQHIHQILCCANYAPGNAGPILWVLDIALPLFLLVVAWASIRTREIL